MFISIIQYTIYNIQYTIYNIQYTIYNRINIINTYCHKIPSELLISFLLQKKRRKLLKLNTFRVKKPWLWEGTSDLFNLIVTWNFNGKPSKKTIFKLFTSYRENSFGTLDTLLYIGSVHYYILVLYITIYWFCTLLYIGSVHF